MSTKLIRPGLTAAMTVGRALLAAGWRYDSTSPMADDTTIRTLLHPTGREIHARTVDGGEQTDLTMTGLSLEQVAGAVTGAGLGEPVTTEKPCDHCKGTGMDSTRHGDVTEDHPCGYCLDGTVPADSISIGPVAGADLAAKVQAEVDATQQPDPRRIAYNLLLTGVAAGLPIPAMVDIPSNNHMFELKVADNDQAAVDAWAAHLGLPAASLGEVIDSGHRAFRNYAADTWDYPAMPGWNVEVCSYIDEPAGSAS